jgi:hypothetical protein
MCSGNPFTAQTSDSDTPVLPPVYSTTAPPGLRRPSASAASIMASATRSFMLPVGFSLSSFSRMRAPFAGTIFRNRSKEVLPMQCRMSRGRSVGVDVSISSLLATEECARSRLGPPCISIHWQKRHI